MLYPDAQVRSSEYLNRLSRLTDVQAREEDGKRPSLDVIKKMAYVFLSTHFYLDMLNIT